MKSAAFPYIYAYILFVAAFNVAFLTWERYTSITKPLWRRSIGNRKIIIVLAINWTLPGFIALLPLCWEYSKMQPLMRSIYRYVLVTVLLFIVATVVIFQTLVLRGLFILWRGKKRNRSSMLTKASKHGQSSQSLKKKLTSMFLVVAVTMSTVATWLPTIILNFRPDFVTTWVTKWSLYSFFVNSLVDPIFILMFNFNVHLRLMRQKRVRRLSTRMRLNRKRGETLTETLELRKVDKEKGTEDIPVGSN